ncbi:MAG: isoprenylcysteine carboxylmethyltransferase family protein [Caldisericota bacterium]|nr:isoprenylcysteine carboxylmethyltransferase family protein [Caldisericota bacterium]
MSRFKKWAEREYSKKQRVIVLFLGGIFFVVAIPFFLITASSHIDKWFHFQTFVYGAINHIIGLLFISMGLLFAVWSIQVQFFVGRGTPVPMIPTQKLVVQRPYSYCRNPMSLGTIIFYLGIAIWSGSLSTVGLALIFAMLLMVYNKMVDETELEERFGFEYLEYKRKTPFLIPRLRKKN